MRLLRAPFALTTEGDLLLSLTEFDMPSQPEAVAAMLARLSGYVFVGVCLPPSDVARVMRDVSMAVPNLSIKAAARWHHRRRRPRRRR